MSCLKREALSESVKQLNLTIALSTQQLAHTKHTDITRMHTEITRVLTEITRMHTENTRMIV